MKMNITRSTKMTSAEKAMRKMEHLERVLAHAQSVAAWWQNELDHHVPGSIIGLSAARADVSKIEAEIAKLSELI